MPVRWSESPEPVLPWFELNGERIQIIDQARIRLVERVDIPADEVRSLEIAVRFDSENDCYGWTNESYFHEFKHPNWKLLMGRYLIRIVIKYSGDETHKIFRLINDVAWKEFRLENAIQEDKRKLTHWFRQKALP
jgi:hypothetical protein